MILFGVHFSFILDLIVAKSTREKLFALWAPLLASTAVVLASIFGVGLWVDFFLFFREFVNETRFLGRLFFLL